MDINEQISLEQLELKQAVTQVLDIAKQMGVSNAEVSVSKQLGISISTRLAEVENIEFNRDGALGITVYQGQSKGSASTSDLRADAIKSTVRAAVEIAQHTSADPYAGLAEYDRMAWNAPSLDLYHGSVLDPERGIALATACERHMLGLDPRIKNSDGASFNSHTGIKVYGNSHGFIDSYLASRHSLSCMPIGEHQGEMQRDYSYSIARDVDQLWSPEQIAEEAVERTLARLGARKIKTQTAPVLFRNDVASSLFGHLVGAIGGGNLYRKSSFLLDSLGEKIFPTWLSIHEDPHLIGGLASAPFDSEGVATEPRSIIEHGILQSYLLTSYSARRLGMQTTGHAGGIYNWLVGANGGDLDSQLKQMGTGLLVTELMGQGVNLVTGDYSRGASGFWVENGQLAYPVHEITIAGNLKQMFQNIVSIGCDYDERASLKTGSLLLDQMKIAGH